MKKFSLPPRLRKDRALKELDRQFDAQTLEALAQKGVAFFTHPVYGPIIRRELGI